MGPKYHCKQSPHKHPISMTGDTRSTRKTQVKT